VYSSSHHRRFGIGRWQPFNAELLSTFQPARAFYFALLFAAFFKSWTISAWWFRETLNQPIWRRRRSSNRYQK
jgi:hypothetical protein